MKPIEVMLNDRPVSFSACVLMMDDELREQLHNEGIEDPQEFLDRYIDLHAMKFDGEEFGI